MGQNFGCNCMDRKEESKMKGNTLPRQVYFQREFQIDGSYEADKGLIWLMNQQRGKAQYQQATYVLKQPVIDLNSSYITESNKSFIVNGERHMIPNNSHCSFDDTNPLSCNNPNKFKIIQLANSEVLNYLNKCNKDPSLIPTYISPHQQDKDECLITLQATDWIFRKQILQQTPQQKQSGNYDYYQKTFNISPNSLTSAYQQIYSYFKKEVQENWSYIGYNFTEKLFGSVDVNLYFQIKPAASHLSNSNSNLSTNRSNSSSQSNLNLFDFETLEKLEPKNVEAIINGNLREGKVFKGCISLLYNEDQNEDWHILIFEKQESSVNQVIITTVDQKVYIQNHDEISMKVQAICELDSLCFHGMITDLRQNNIQIIFAKETDQVFY